MATTMDGRPMDGSRPNMDPRDKTRNNGLYWGIAAAIVVLLAIVLTRPTARDIVPVTNKGTTTSDTYREPTGTAAQRSTVNGAATTETVPPPPAGVNANGNPQTTQPVQPSNQ